MTEPQQSPPMKSRRGLKIALIVSLGLNLLLLGIGFGSAFHHHRAPFGPSMSLHHLTAGLPEDARKTVDSVMAAHRDRIHELARDLKKQQRAIINLLRADTIDRPALDAAFYDVQVVNGKLQNEIHTATREAAEQLPLDIRQKLTRRMMRMEHQHRERREYDNDDDEAALAPPPLPDDPN